MRLFPTGTQWELEALWALWSRCGSTRLFPACWSLQAAGLGLGTAHLTASTACGSLLKPKSWRSTLLWGCCLSSSNRFTTIFSIIKFLWGKSFIPVLQMRKQAKKNVSALPVLWALRRHCQGWHLSEWHMAALGQVRIIYAFLHNPCLPMDVTELGPVSPPGSLCSHSSNITPHWTARHLQGLPWLDAGRTQPTEGREVCSCEHHGGWGERHHLLPGAVWGVPGH